MTTKAYDGTTAAAITGATLSGIVGTDEVILTDATNGTFDNANSGTDKTVTTSMSITGAAIGNYTLTQPILTGTITAKELTVTGASVTTKVYDGTDAATISGATLSGVVGNEDVMLINATNGTFDNANSGTDKTVTTSMSITGAAIGNYTLTQPILTGTITAKELTVTGASVTTKVYDGTDAATISGATLSGVVGNEDVMLINATSGTFDNANAGTDKSVTTTMSITGAAIGNYTLTQPILTGTITAKELTVTGASVTTKVYDGTDAATISGATLSGVVGNEDVMLINATSGTFDNANAGTDKSVTTTMSITGAAIGNYTLTQPVLTGNISARPITIDITAQNKVYDGNIVADVTVSTTSGLVPGEEVIASAANGAFDTKDAGNDKTVTANISISGTNAGNYTCNHTAATTANITQAALTIGITAQNKVYDGNTDATVIPSITSGLITGDLVTVTASNARFDTKEVGNDKTVTADISISGADAGNYTFNTTATTTANITRTSLVPYPDSTYTNYVMVYPTLSQGMFSITIKKPEPGKLTVRIINTSGLIVREFQFKKLAQDETFPVNIGTAATGYYLVEVSMDGYREINKIIIDK